MNGGDSVEDAKIVALYWERSELALSATADKYGDYLSSIALNILANREDAQECVNDTYHDAWNAMPPHRPNLLQTFLGKITRRISIDRWRQHRAAKRGGGELPLVLEELSDCVSGAENIEDELSHLELVRRFNRFLKALPATERCIFLRRYWYMDSIPTIAERYGFSRSKVTSMLHRTRGKLRTVLEQEGYI